MAVPLALIESLEGQTLEGLDLEQQENRRQCEAADLAEDLEDAQVEFEIMKDTVASASEAAHSLNTQKNYKGQWTAFEKFAEKYCNISKNELLDPDDRLPTFVVNWIYSMCDIPDLKSDVMWKKMPKNMTYSHACKMRASISHHYGNVLGRGTDLWRKEKDGSHSGNPSLSHAVSRYMKSLQRRKIRDGQVSQSVRSIDVNILQQLYMKNSSYKVHTELQRLPLDMDNHRIWGGHAQRRMMQCMYAIAFLCLLRFDEVLHIQHHHIKILDQERGAIEITLPFRKTSQVGEIKPFVLYWDRENPHLDVPHLLLRWLHISRIESGYLFRGFNAYDQPSQANRSLNPTVFLDNFRNNLIDVGVDPEPYGTHSFRRGGVQYFSSEKRWNIRKLCDWGGWSMAYDSLTIVRYLIGWNDDPVHKREDYMNPEAQQGKVCNACGRTCDCA